MGCNSSKGVSGPTEKAEEGRVMCGRHMKNVDSLTSYPQFPAGTTSLLSKALTKEIWEEYHDKSCAKGVSFKTNIFSGCKNTDSGIGAYAGSADAYTTFNKLFD